MITARKKSIRDLLITDDKRLEIIFLALMGTLILAAVLFLFVFFFPSKQPQNSDIASVPTCGDGSFYNTCSLDKPYYCNNGTLISNVLECGCPSSTVKQANSCVSKYQTAPKTINLGYVLDGGNGSINFVVYQGLVNYLSTLPESIVYTDGQQPNRADFTLMRLNEPNQKVLLEPLVKDIENLAPNDKVNQARIAISLVQNIPWGSSEKQVSFAGVSANYSRYPYQVLYDTQGLCSEKSELLAFILKDIGYGVVLFYYPVENHEAVGIKCPVQYSLGGTGYCFVETSGPAIISDSNLKYANGELLNSTPQVILISNGISLPDNLTEYQDAKTMDSLMSRRLLDPISENEFKQLEIRYGLGKVYNLN